jgi:hypothetical protein
MVAEFLAFGSPDGGTCCVALQSAGFHVGKGGETRVSGTSAGYPPNEQAFTLHRSMGFADFGRIFCRWRPFRQLWPCRADSLDLAARAPGARIEKIRFHTLSERRNLCGKTLFYRASSLSAVSGHPGLGPHT